MKKNFIRCILFLLIMVVFAIFISCSKDEEIKIGVAVSLSSSNSPMGMAVKDTVVLAAEEVNEQGGIDGQKIKLIIKDDQNNPKIAEVIDNELIDEGVVAIIGHITSFMTKSALNLMNEKDMLLMSPTTSTKDVIEIEDNMISLNPPNVLEQEELVDYIISQTDIRRIAIISDLDNSVFSDSWRAYFTNHFTRKGGTITKQLYFESTNKEDIEDIYDMVNSAIDGDTEGVLMIASAVDVPLISQQIMKIDSKIMKISSGWAFDENLIYNGGMSVENLIISVSWDYDSDNPEYVSFKKNFFERYGRYPNYTEAYTYETMQILFEALQSVGEKKPMTIKDKILEISEFEGLQGSIRIDRFGGTHRDAYIYTVKEGSFIRADEK